MNEYAVTFGPANRLTGVLCEPDPGRAPVDAPMILTWNVGVNHHVGPYRFSVDLARALARAGLSSLRFDISGLGDSDARTDALLEHERALTDVGDAMTFLERRYRRRRFILVGFCSGVDAAHGVAVRDERVEGVCFIEGYTFRTRGFLVRYPLRYFELARWVRFATRNMPSVLRELPLFRELGRFSRAFSKEDRVFVRSAPSPESLRGDYDAMAARGTRQLFVYMGRSDYYNHPRQFLEFTGMRALPSTTEVLFLPRADHTLFRVADRAQVIGRIAAWAAESAPSSRCEASPATQDSAREPVGG